MKIWSSSSASTSILTACSGEKSRDAIIQMILDFFIFIQKSKRKFIRYKEILTQHEDFDVVEAMRDVCSHHKFSDNSLSVPDNIRRCLEALRLVNIIIQRLYTLKRELFDINNPTHMTMLVDFWRLMKGNKDIDWLEVGFQGSDPSTDFRSMGILALMQLIHFSKNRNDTAKMILELFSNNHRYFPFAIIGVNITRFVFELIEEQVILRLLIKNIGHVFAGELSSYDILPSSDEVCIAFGINIVHDFYCIIFEEFYMQWVITNPANVMEFSATFEAVQVSIRRKYASL